MTNTSIYRIAIIGGGAAGFFAAIESARLLRQHNLQGEVVIFEASNQFLKKVKISGGGRCNVTHHQFQIKEFCQNYPRGQRELVSAFHQFQAQDTVNWFKQLGVELISEEDGRMFPSSHSSQTIINCYLEQCANYNVQLKLRTPVKSIQVLGNRQFLLQTNDSHSFSCHACLIATGSSPAGYRLAESLGHSITDRAPSLFSFKIEDPLIADLPGISFDWAQLKLVLANKKIFQQTGPVLITHWGLSGPGILKLSAWAARELKQVNYQATLTVNWLGDHSWDSVVTLLNTHKLSQQKSLLKNSSPAPLPKRFWHNILIKAHIDPEKQWTHLSKKEVNQLATLLTQSELKTLGQNRYKDEFVECGGVSLKEVDFRSMESKVVPGIYFAGELLDVDGITGGFNFQNAWTTGWIAAQDMVKKMGQIHRN
jgi:predicted Rossmann fold flavoprotein